jgi:methyl-accepting chemotaxis protein
MGPSEDGSLDKSAKGLSGIQDTLKELINPLAAVGNAIGNMVAQGDKLNNSFGLARARIEEMKVSFSDSVAGVQRLGGSLDDVSNTIIQIAKASNRNVIENEAVISQMYAASKVLNTDVETLVNNFKNVGYEASQIGTNLESSIEYIQSVGLNATTVMKDVSNNMDKMNRFQFEGGVAGLSKMAAQASMLRFDMSQTFQFADKVMSPEGAINMASAFQRLGVTAGNLVDPFALMNQSILDPTGLQNSLARLGQKFTYFSEETQSFKINPEGVLTLKQMEDEAGLLPGTLSKSALAAADLDKRLSQVSTAGLKFENEEDKQYLANIAKMGKGGKYEVTLNDGTKKELQNLNQEEFNELIEQQKNAPKNVEEIQRAQLGQLENLNGNIKAFLSAGKFGIASTRQISGSMEGLRNIFTTFGDNARRAIKKTPEVREDVSSAITEMKNLLSQTQKGSMTSEDFVRNAKNIGEILSKKGNVLSEQASDAIKKILKETASDVKGSSFVENMFRKNILGESTSGVITPKKTEKAPKPLTLSQVMGAGTTSRNIPESSSQSKQVTSKVDVGGVITVKFEVPAGTTLTQQQLNAMVNSEEFKQYLVNVTRKNSSENKGSGVVSYG